MNLKRFLYYALLLKCWQVLFSEAVLTSIISPPLVYDKGICKEIKPCLLELITNEEVEIKFLVINSDVQKNDFLNVQLEINDKRDQKFSYGCGEAECEIIAELSTKDLLNSTNNLTLHVASPSFEPLHKFHFVASVQDQSVLRWCPSCNITNTTNESLIVSLAAEGYPSPSIYKLMYSNGTVLDMINRTSSVDTRDNLTVKIEQIKNNNLSFVAGGRNQMSINRTISLAADLSGSGIRPSGTGHASNTSGANIGTVIIGISVGLVIVIIIAIVVIRKYRQFFYKICARFHPQPHGEPRTAAPIGVQMTLTTLSSQSNSLPTSVNHVNELASNFIHNPVKASNSQLGNNGEPGLLTGQSYDNQGKNLEYCTEEFDALFEPDIPESEQSSETSSIIYDGGEVLNVGSPPEASVEEHRMEEAKET